MKYILILISLSLLLFAKEKACDIKSITNDTTKKSMQKWLNDDFGLKPYRPNYLLPFGYRKDAYVSTIPTIEYKNIEAEMEISLKMQLAHNTFGWNERYYVSYTHQAFWQIYAASSPFRENLYNPEAFVIIPIDEKGSGFRVRSLKFALAHKSNGEADTSNIVFTNSTTPGNLSRSVNYVYSTLRVQRESLIVDLEVWAPLPEDKELNDNPDLMDYIGYGSVKLHYFYNDHMFTVKGRGNLSTLKGSLEATYSYPLVYNYLYIKAFSGYGESLIDYNNYISKISIGFAFSR